MIKMARSTYYYRSKKEGKKRLDAEVLKKIEAILVEFPKYGSRKRVPRELRRRGVVVNHKRVYRIMKEARLLRKNKRRFRVYTTDSNHDYPIHPNRTIGLVVVRINQLWVADLTYIHLGKGFVYLAVILDAFSRKAIGYALSRSLQKELALEALRMALRNRKPPPGCLHHSDRGVQYASHEYVDLLKENHFEISMSRRGNPYDNAKAESFMKTLKVEEVYLSEYETFEEAACNVFGFIEEVYNQKRLHSSIGYLPPNEFEENLMQKAG